MRHSLDERVRSKSVEASVSIDDMEEDRGWVASPAAQLSYTGERARIGKRSLRFATEQRSEAYIRQSRLPDGSFTAQAALFDTMPAASTARLRFASPQDWSAYNRISVWCYVHPSGNPVNSVALQFVCEDAPAGPADPIAVHYAAELKQGRWNFITWELPEHRRDKVVELTLFVPVFGLPFARSKSALLMDFDDLRIDRVKAELPDGWKIPAGTIAFSHAGYSRSGSKIAIGPAGQAKFFELIHADSGEVARELTARRVETRRGQYSIYDFSEFDRPGRYRLRAEGVLTEAFAISDMHWVPLIEAVLNAYFGLRCGFDVPGAHDACHRDVFARHGEEVRSVGGGWHDAANLSQDPENTCASVCALIDLAEALQTLHPDLSGRALEEARWGLHWIERMRFGPGMRLLHGGYSYFTDSKRGTIDDSIDEHVGSNTFLNTIAALAQARGAKAFHRSDPQWSAQLLQAAEEDFATILSDRATPKQEADPPRWTEQPWQNEVGYMTLLATELHRLTHRAIYAEAAVRFGTWLLELQERRFIDGAPVTGYFYEDRDCSRILHEYQRTSGAPNSFEEGALLAYQALCETFSDHPDWIRWYSGLVAYSQFYCAKGAQASAPFDVVPAAVWRARDLTSPFPQDRAAGFLSAHANALFPTPVTPELIQRQMRAMFEAGAYLSPDQRLRTFPLWLDHIRHGSSCVHLTKTIGLAAAAQLRKNEQLRDLAARQIAWEIGANPFSRSLVYGVGYDWWQNFTVSVPNLVGGISVGMNSYNDDAPAWGNNAVFPYKEIWVLSSARLAAVLARVRLSGAEPRSDSTPSLQLDSARADVPEPVLRLAISGGGAHEIELRVENLELAPARFAVDLGSKGTRKFQVRARVKDHERPWIAVAIIDGDPRAEAFGTAQPLQDLALAHTVLSERSV